jgi:hypothetical protein
MSHPVCYTRRMKNMKNKMKNDGIYKVSFSNGEQAHVRANGSDHALRIGNQLAKTWDAAGIESSKPFGSAVIASEILIHGDLLDA